MGNLTDVKDHQCLIKAMKGIDANLLIIGKGKLYSDLQKLIKKNDLQEKIDIKTSVPHEKIAEYYRSAQIFALAYFPEFESIPKPVMEAMACGLPVVITQSTKEFTTGLENVAVLAKRVPSSFEEKINQLLNEPEILKKFSVKSLEAAKKFDSEKIEERQSQIYSELIEKGK